MSELINLPIGFRFDPTDEELITGFLFPKVMGLPLPWNGFLERDLYGDNTAPWDVFGDIDESSFYWHTRKEGEKSKGTKKTIYVFTKLMKAHSNSNSKRVSRRAGGGTWNGQTGPRKIQDSKSGEFIGTTRMLSFQYSKTSSSETGSFGHWIMHEYALDGVSLIGSERCNIDLVLCKITKCLKENDRHRVQQPEHQQLYIPMSDYGGAPGIQIPTTTGSYKVETSNKRSVEECNQEDASDWKKQKLCFGYEDDDLLVGLDMVGNWNIDELLQGL